MTVATDQTAEVLVAMLTENTGRHMLDSGGAYGRNWERNQGLDLEFWQNQDLVNVEPWGDGEFTLSVNVFPFLSECLEFDEDLQAQFDAFAEERPDDSWLSLMEEWADSFEDSRGLYGEGRPMTWNTYNGEDALSQVLQYTYFESEVLSGGGYGEGIVLLQIHGGCDVRGGYTAPKVFRHYDGGMWSIWDNARLAAWTRYPESNDPRLFDVPSVPDAFWTSDNAGYTFYSEGGSGNRETDWAFEDGKVIYKPWGSEVHFGVT